MGTLNDSVAVVLLGMAHPLSLGTSKSILILQNLSGAAADGESEIRNQ